jgi:hypothetical protein
MGSNSGTGGLGVTGDLFGIDGWLGGRVVASLVRNDCGGHVAQLDGLGGGKPGALGDSTSGPPLNSGADVAAGTLLASQVRVQSSGNDTDLLGGLCLREGRSSPQKALEQVGCQVLSHPRRFRFMNRIPVHVNHDLKIQERERAKILDMSGREPDDAVAWYCHMRISAMIAEGMNQKQIALAAKLPKSAINHLVMNAKGVGPGTAAALSVILGFTTRGALTDEADEWWATQGERYAAREMKAMARARQLRAARSAAKKTLRAGVEDDKKIA